MRQLELPGTERHPGPPTVTLADGATLLRGFAKEEAPRLYAAIEHVVVAAPFRHMITPGGRTMSVAMTNCGAHGWVTDSRGYRYTRVDPVTDRPWPEMPAAFSTLAARAAAQCGFENFDPDACLINRYAPATRLSLHQDKDEHDRTMPIVSVSLGISAVFLFGGLTRADPARRVPVDCGDVVVWGGPLRLAFHGVAPLANGDHPLTGRYRINLTLRRAR